MLMEGYTQVKFFNIDLCFLIIKLFVFERLLVQIMKKKNHGVIRAFTMVSQIGISFITPIGLCVIAGYYIDRHFHTSCWFIILFFLGVLAAFRNVYILTKGFYEMDLKRENEELEYWKHLTTEDKSSKNGSVSDNDNADEE